MTFRLFATVYAGLLLALLAIGASRAGQWDCAGEWAAIDYAFPTFKAGCFLGNPYGE